VWVLWSAVAHRLLYHSTRGLIVIKKKEETAGTIPPGQMSRGFEAGSYLRLIDFVYHSTLGLSVIKKKKNTTGVGVPRKFWKIEENVKTA